MAEDQEPAIKKPKAARVKAKVVIVDDDEDLRADLVSLLREDGFQAEGAADGLAGFSVATKLDPDIVVLDMGLPLVDGFKLGQKFKQDPRTSDVPILFLTTSLDEEAMVSSLTLFGCDHLPKPVSRRDFLTKIEGMSHKKAIQERLRRAAQAEKPGRASSQSQPAPTDKDPLTGLPSWLIVKQRLEEELVRADRHKIPYVFLVLGVDNLAEIGRTIGKDLARSIYKDVGTLIRRKTRRYNVVGHFEEALFTIVLFQSDPETARAVAERLRTAVASQEFRHPHGRVITTVSIGLCHLAPEELASLKRQGADVIQTVLHKAKEAYQLAHSQGGNRIHFSAPPQ